MLVAQGCGGLLRAVGAAARSAGVREPFGGPNTGVRGPLGVRRDCGTLRPHQGTSHRPVTGQYCPLLAADRTSRATCSGEAGTGKKMEGRLSGGRNSDPTNPDRPDRTSSARPFPNRSAMAPVEHPPAGRHRRPRAKIVASGAPYVFHVFTVRGENTRIFSVSELWSNSIRRPHFFAVFGCSAAFGVRANAR
jgi:hypothetical protein